MRFPATFTTRDFFIFDWKNPEFSRIICQNLHHEIKKNRNMIRNIRDIKYPRLLNFCIFATFSTCDFYNCFFRDI